MKRKRVLLAFQYYHADYHEGAARYAREQGWILDALYARARGETPSLGMCDGILVHALQNDPLRRMIERSSLPTVDLAGTLRRTGVPRVMHDSLPARCSSSILLPPEFEGEDEQDTSQHQQLVLSGWRSVVTEYVKRASVSEATGCRRVPTHMISHLVGYVPCCIARRTFLHCVHEVA